MGAIHQRPAQRRASARRSGEEQAVDVARDQRFTGGAPEYEQEPGQDDPKAKAALIQLSRILDELSADERAAFVLSNLEGLALLEIAQALGVSESTAKRRVRRANEHVLKRVSRNALLADYVQVRTERQHG